jgi:hypothetical protein
MRRRYPLYPATDQALRETLIKFGVDVDAKQITDEDREIAARFDVGAALDEANQQVAHKQQSET